jgi:hypothetical protein
MRQRRHFLKERARPLSLAIVVLALLAPTLGAPAATQASSSSLAPRLGPGNHMSMGSRESGIYFEYTLDGADCGERQSDGGITCTLTSDMVTASGTLYVSLGEGLYTRPSAEAKLGQEWAPTEEWQQVSWPPDEMRDAEGYVSGPFEHEEAFNFSWDVKPELGVVIFNVWVGKVNGSSEGAGVGAWMYPPAATDTPEVPVPTDMPVPAATQAPAAGGKPPCPEPLYFYPDQDFSTFYTGTPSLRYTQEELTNDLLRGLQRYAASPGAQLNDGALPWDVANIAMTFTSDSTLEDGRKVAPALQDAARALAQQRQENDPSYRVSPGDLLELSLKLSGGNVRNALITCHAATYRDAAGVNNKFVQQEGILAPIRDPNGYADTKWTYTTPWGAKRPVDNPRESMGADQQGVWYHLYGMAALEYTDGYNAASYYGAQVAIWAIGDTSKRDALEKVRDKGFPITGLGGVLGDLANALEEAIRSRAGRPPDVDKNCINYWGLKAGHELRRLVNNPQLVLPPPDGWTPGGQFRQDTNQVFPLGHGKVANERSPLSMRIDGTGGEWFSFDQSTQQFDGNTPLVLFDFYPEDDGTIGLVAQPLFEVSSIQMTATGTGPAQIATYDPATRKAEAYELTVQQGDQITISGQDEPAQLNGSLLTPAAITFVRKPFPFVPIAAGAGGVLLLAAISGVLLARHRSGRARRARPAAAPAARVPVPPAQAAVAAGQGTCRACGAPLKAGTKFCGSCGAPVPEAPPAGVTCPECGSTLPSGARFCGNCGATIAEAPPPPLDTCPQCGSPVNPGARFCGTCGRASG